MDRREFTVALAAAGPWCARAATSETEAASGVRAALERSALAAVSRLGRVDGFLGDPRVHIPLPGPLKAAASLLRATGQGRMVDELETAMNRGAEAAVPQARELFVNTVKAMSVEDALKLVRSDSPTAVTDFFAGKMRVPLGEKFLPVVTQATERLQLARRYNAVAARAAGVGLVKGDEASVQRYFTGRALDGLFLVMGDEEKKIRADPLRTGSAILRKVFGR